MHVVALPFVFCLPTPTRKALQHKSLNPKNGSAPTPLTLKIPTAPKPYNQFSAGQVAVAPSRRKPHPEGPKCAARVRGPSAGAIRIGERFWGYIMQEAKTLRVQVPDYHHILSKIVTYITSILNPST